jgi:hypothetical protein
VRVEPLEEVTVGDGDQALGQAQGGAGHAARGVVAGGEVGEVLLDGGGGRGLGPGRGDVEAAVVVAAAGEVLLPRPRVPRVEAVALGEVAQDLGGEAAEDGGGQLVEVAVVDAVAHLEALEEHQELLDVLEGQAVVDAVEGMGYRVDDRLVVEVIAQGVDVVAQTLDLGVLRLGHSGDQAVDHAAVLGERHRHLRGQEDPRQVGDLEGTGDGVVVADGDEVHAPRAAGAVELERLGEALRRRDSAKEPLVRTVGVFGVNVQVDAGRGHALLQIGWGSDSFGPGAPMALGT